MRRQATAHNGANCVVKKHSSMGCAVVSLTAVQVRQAICDTFQDKEKIDIAGHSVTLKAHADKETGDIPTDVFVGWGRQAEKNDPLSEQDLADWFDAKHQEFATLGRVTAQAVQGGARAQTEDEKRANAQKTAAAQAQWAASGGQAPAVRTGVPPGPPPAGAPGAVGYNAQAQAQAQYMAAMQAQYMMRYQQQQAAYYAQAMQAQQQQQAYLAHLKQQQEAQALQAKNRKAGYKASYRVPTDEEVQASIQRLNKTSAPAEDAPAGDAPATEAAPVEAAAEPPAAA